VRNPEQPGSSRRMHAFATGVAKWPDKRRRRFAACSQSQGTADPTALRPADEYHARCVALRGTQRETRAVSKLSRRHDELYAAQPGGFWDFTTILGASGGPYSPASHVRAIRNSRLRSLWGDAQ
jgi:hypothetical protein